MFEATFFKRRPDSHFKKNGELTAKGRRHPYPDKRQEPDADKALRATGDALSGLAYTDDKRIVTIIGKWRWREQPGADIAITALQNQTLFLGEQNGRRTSNSRKDYAQNSRQH